MNEKPLFWRDPDTGESMCDFGRILKMSLGIPEYEPPKLTKMGNIRDLTMAGGTVWASDSFSMWSAGPPPITRS
jgi:hypothetical protein